MLYEVITVGDRLLLAARRGLAYTDNSVTVVARDLGFADPSVITSYSIHYTKLYDATDESQLVDTAFEFADRTGDGSAR